MESEGIRARRREMQREKDREKEREKREKFEKMKKEESDRGSARHSHHLLIHTPPSQLHLLITPIPGIPDSQVIDRYKKKSLYNKGLYFP